MKHLKWLSLCGIVTMTVGLLALTACGGDDNDDPQPNGNNQTNNNGNNNGNFPQINPDLVVGSWSTVYANVSYVDEVGTKLSHNGSVDPSKEEDWPFYNMFTFGADGSFIGFAINYHGDGEYYGRFEETQIGKYSFDAATNTTTLYDLIMGYHDVQAYKAGQTDVPRTKMYIKIQSLTEDELVCSIDGLGTYKMKKEKEEQSTLSESDINYAYLDGTWALVHKKGKDAEHDYDKDFPPADNDGYEELVFGSTNTVQHWKQSGEQWICDVSSSYVRTGNVITLGEMNINVMMLTKDVLVLDMGDEIITARKIELEGVWALVHKKGKDAEHNYDEDFPTAGNNGYEELVFGPSNTVQHWAQKKGRWSCDVEGTYTRTGDVITLGEMNITILKLKLTNLVLDMENEIITARKLTESAYK